MQSVRTARIFCGKVFLLDPEVCLHYILLISQLDLSYIRTHKTLQHTQNNIIVFIFNNQMQLLKLQ